MHAAELRELSVMFVVLAACSATRGSTTQQLEAAKPVDFKSCASDANDDYDTCHDDCVDSYPEDPNPDPVSCPWFKGDGALARLTCITQCDADRANAMTACCQNGTVDGKPIDRNGGTDEAKTCNAAACTAPLLGDSVLCYQTYGGYTGQDVFGDACAIDVFGFCDPPYNDIADACKNPPPSCGTCNLNLPPEVPDLIKMLGSDDYDARQGAQAKLTAILQDALANASDRQCAINSIRNLLGNADSSDPEVAARLRQIWSNLIYSTQQSPPSVVPRVDCAALDVALASVPHTTREVS